MKIYFPQDTGQKYYARHYAFFLSLFKFMYLNIELCDPEPRSANLGGFVIRIDGKRILMDFADFLEPVEDSNDFDACFKNYYSIEHCGQHKNIYPISPISFHDWEEYYEFKKLIKYKCNTDCILNNQKVQHGKKKRRMIVRKTLKDRYGDLVDGKITDKVEFWMKINSCLVSICVPGQREDILDIGQFQYMAFGACTVSPQLTIMLPYMVDLVSGIHYVECARDYSDLIEKIEWCKQHRAECIQIGKNVKRLFYKTCTPSAVWTWMEGIITKKATL